MTEQGLLAQLRAVKGEDINPTHICAVGRWLATLDDKERKQYEEILDSREFQASSIARILRNNKILISDQQVRRHRNRLRMSGCSCQ